MTNPTITSSAVMPLCISKRSTCSRRRNSCQTREGGGRMKAGMPSSGGSHSQAARKATSSPALARSVPLLNEFVRVEVANRRFFLHDALLHVELLQRGHARGVDDAEGLLARIDERVVEAEDLFDVGFLALVLRHRGDVIGHRALGVGHDV